MKNFNTKLSLLLLVITLTTYSGFAQHVDWIHAPKNPIPRGSSLQYQNLKGAVFQESISDYYTKDGQWFPYNAEFEIRRDNQGRVVYFKDRYSTYQYVYDNKGKLLEEKQDNSPYRVFEYDSKNRVVKTTYTNPKNNISTITYSYTQDGTKCTVNEIRTHKDGEIVVREIRYKNGLEVYAHTQGFPATIYTYEYDAQGNWIVRTILDAETKQPLRNKFDGKVAPPSTRSIIYHNEYEKGLQALTVQMTDLTNGAVANARLVPIVFINGKEFKKMLFSRFINDFVFYDPLSKTYYIARNAYLGTYKKDQKIPVEILSTGAENVLLFNGLKVKALERGDEGELKDWNFINYIKGLGAFIGTNKTANKAYAFLNMPTVTNEKVVAVPGTAINDLWYMPAEDKKNVYLFENGEYVRGKYAMVGTLGNTTSLNLVVSVDGATTYVFPEYDKALEKHVYKARLFNPSTDVLKSTTTTNSTPTTSNTTSTTTASNTTNDTSKTNTTKITYPKKDYSNYGLTSFAQGYLEAYSVDPSAAAQHITDLGVVLKNHYPEGTKLFPKFLAVLEEIYYVDNFIAYETLINTNKSLFDYCMANMKNPIKQHLVRIAKMKLKQNN
ncbi:hypothetical protein [Gaetbulibacter sp. PBL-D1]|uniref:hypothetical protein n=1 Tax=Gaetbulibacter sp. PBL-D1 TaxID=3422594 RepID=UPI003D2F0A64